MITAPLLILSILPAFLVFYYFYSRDLYPEPRHAIVKTFLLGCIVPILIVLIFVYPIDSPASGSSPIVSSFYRAFLQAAIPEEFGKFLVLWLYCSKISDFDEPMDGLVYGVTASLGFAMVENILYVFEGGFVVATLRAISSVPGHAVFGAIMGYYFSVAHFDHSASLRHYAKALAVPIFFHGFYNFPLMLAAAYGGFSLPHLGMLFLCVFSGSVMLAAHLARKTRMLQIEFHPELQTQLFLVRTPLSKSWSAWLSISLGGGTLIVFAIFAAVLIPIVIAAIISFNPVIVVFGSVIPFLLYVAGITLYRKGISKLNELDHELSLDMKGIDVKIEPRGTAQFDP